MACRLEDRALILTVALRERATDRFLAGLKRRRRVSAWLVLTAKGARDRRVVVRRAVRLRR